MADILLVIVTIIVYALMVAFACFWVYLLYLVARALKVFTKKCEIEIDVLNQKRALFTQKLEQSFRE